MCCITGVRDGVGLPPGQAVRVVVATVDENGNDINFRCDRDIEILVHCLMVM